ncbi:MAG: cell division protein FtsX [Vampirovibrionales bacterium]
MTLSYTLQQLLHTLFRDIRVCFRIILETLGGLRRSGWMNVLITVTMASILTIFGCLTTIIMDSHYFLDTFGTELKISVYLKEGRSIEATTQQIERLPAVESVTPVPKAEAWNKIKASYKDFPDISNPLPDTLHIQVESTALAGEVIKAVKLMENDIEAVNYPYATLKKIQDFAKALSLYGYVFFVFLGVLTISIIYNTISLLIQNRGREIEILRMMGVSNWYIRLPFLLQGAFYGVLGAVLAYIPVVSLQVWMTEALSNIIAFKAQPSFLNLVFIAMLLLGVLVSCSGTVRSMRKYLLV